MQLCGSGSVGSVLREAGWIRFRMEIYGSGSRIYTVYVENRDIVCIKTNIFVEESPSVLSNFVAKSNPSKCCNRMQLYITNYTLQIFCKEICFLQVIARFKKFELNLISLDPDPDLNGKFWQPGSGSV